MKKIIAILISTMLFSATAYAGGSHMIGVKIGYGEVEGNAKAYTSGSNAEAAESNTIETGYGAIFAEANIMDSPFSVGVEYIPFDAVLSTDTASTDSSVTISDHTTLYALGVIEVADGISLFAKVGYSEADLGSVKANANTTVNSQSTSLDGHVLGAGVQIGSAGGWMVRLAGEVTDYDEVKITTTSNGSTSVEKKGDVDTETLSISIAKSF